MLVNRAKDKDWTQEGIYVTFTRDVSDPGTWTKPIKILDAGDLDKSRWYPQIVGIDATRHEDGRETHPYPRYRDQL